MMYFSANTYSDFCKNHPEVFLMLGFSREPAPDCCTFCAVLLRFFQSFIQGTIPFTKKRTCFTHFLSEYYQKSTGQLFLRREFGLDGQQGCQSEQWLKGCVYCYSDFRHVHTPTEKLRIVKVEDVRSSHHQNEGG